jgi:hypothetical protein
MYYSLFRWIAFFLNSKACSLFCRCKPSWLDQNTLSEMIGHNGHKTLSWSATHRSLYSRYKKKERALPLIIQSTNPPTQALPLLLQPTCDERKKRRTNITMMVRHASFCLILQKHVRGADCTATGKIRSAIDRHPLQIYVVTSCNDRHCKNLSWAPIDRRPHSPVAVCTPTVGDSRRTIGATDMFL